ncbi:MAG: hypothetical protein LBE55_06050 [Clostridiales bacterium]|jgi:hypothetical protein|nr:hypothetical protein [Clostridiales bacterium]
MGIRPVDLQVMVQRAPEVNRATNNDGSRAETQNNQFAQSFQKVVEQEGKQVNLANQAEKTSVDKDGRGKGGDKDGKDQKRRGHDGEQDNKGVQNRGLLDIKI